MNFSETVYEKLALVPLNIYDEIIRKCDPQEKSEIEAINQSDPNTFLSMESNENEKSRNELEKSIEMEANQVKDNANPVLLQNSSEPSIERSKESLVNADMSNGKNFQKDDCPPTSENSILRIKPYLCTSCSKRYATPFTLKRHQKQKHPVIEEISTQQGIQPNEKFHQSPKNFTRFAGNEQLARKRKAIEEDALNEEAAVPFKRTRMSTGEKRKISEPNDQQRKRKRILNCENF